MIECGLIVLPNFSNTEKYFLIQIKELEDGPYDSLDPHIAKSIALVPNRNALANYNYILETHWSHPMKTNVFMLNQSIITKERKT